MNDKLEQILERFGDGTPTEWALFLIAAVAIVGAVWGLTRYRSSLHGDADPAEDHALLVRHVRELRDGGAVSEEEYRSLKSRLTPKADETSHGPARSDRDDEGRNPAGEAARSNGTDAATDVGVDRGNA